MSYLTRAALWRDLAHVAICDREAIEQPHAWPPRPPMTAEESEQTAHLYAVEQACFDKAEAIELAGIKDFRRRAYAQIYRPKHGAA